MGFQRITPEQIAAKGVSAAPDRMIGKAADNKGVFDRLVREVVTAAYNGLLDALEAQSGAGGLGAAPFPNVVGTTVQGQLEGIQGNVEENHAFLATQAAAGYVGATPFGILRGETVQAQLLGLLAAHEELKNADGADYVGAEPFNGVPSGTVQGQMRDVMKAVEDINAGIIPAQSVTWEKLGLDVVEKIAAPVVEEKLADGAVSTVKLTAGAVTGEKLAAGAVTADKITLSQETLFLHGFTQQTGDIDAILQALAPQFDRQRHTTYELMRTGRFLE